MFAHVRVRQLTTLYLLDLQQMKSLQSKVFPFVAALLLLVLAQAPGPAMAQVSDIELVRFEARTGEDPHEIIVEWEVSEASDVSSGDFELRRNMSSNGSEFQQLNSSSIEGGPRIFRYKDSDLFKGTSDEVAETKNVTYQLYANGELLGETQQGYTTNAARSTWGSIKAMFQ